LTSRHHKNIIKTSSSQDDVRKVHISS